MSLHAKEKKILVLRGVKEKAKIYREKP